MLHECVIRTAAERARLAARLDVVTDQAGTRLSGEIDPVFDRLHQRILRLEDQLLDLGIPPHPGQVRWFKRAASYLEQVHRSILRQARRDIAAA